MLDWRWYGRVPRDCFCIIGEINNGTSGYPFGDLSVCFPRKVLNNIDALASISYD